MQKKTNPISSMRGISPYIIEQTRGRAPRLRLLVSQPETKPSYYICQLRNGEALFFLVSLIITVLLNPSIAADNSTPTHGIFILAQANSQGSEQSDDTNPWWEELSEKLESRDGRKSTTEENALQELPPGVIQPVDQPPPEQIIERIEIEQQQRVRKLLVSAEQHLTANRLTTPAKNNALESYRQVLALVPGQKEALDGIAVIVAKYKSWATKASNSGQYGTAELYVRRAMEANPDDATLMKMLQKVEIAKRSDEIRKRQRQVQSTNKSRSKPETATASQRSQPSFNRPVAEPQISEVNLNAQRIQRLLARAKQQFERRQLIGPPHNNAWETYSQVLAIDTANQQAKNGLQLIPAELEKLIRYQQQIGNLDAALSITENGLQRYPGHPELMRMQNEIADQQQIMQQDVESTEASEPQSETDTGSGTQQEKSAIIRPYGTF